MNVSESTLRSLAENKPIHELENIVHSLEVNISKKGTICMKTKHKPMSIAKLFRLMQEHPNPVTRAVYRDMYFKRISEEYSSKTSGQVIEE